MEEATELGSPLGFSRTMAHSEGAAKLLASTNDVQCKIRYWRNVTKELQSWSSKKIGSVKLQLLVAKELILRLDRAQDTRVLSPAEEDLRRQLKKLPLDLASLERTIARQHSRIMYLSEGDANT